MTTKLCKVLTNWLGLPKDFSPESYEGFVYLVVNTLTQQSYIGRKYFWKGRPRKKARKESDWKFYKSSSIDLQNDIIKYGEKNFEFKILALYKTRSEVNYNEIREQFIRDVLHAKLPNGDYAYYNTCLMHRYWRKKSIDNKEK